MYNEVLFYLAMVDIRSYTSAGVPWLQVYGSNARNVAKLLQDSCIKLHKIFAYIVKLITTKFKMYVKILEVHSKYTVAYVYV